MVNSPRRHHIVGHTGKVIATKFGFRAAVNVKHTNFLILVTKVCQDIKKNHFTIDLIENNGVLTCKDTDPLDTTGRVLRAVSESVTLYSF